MVSSSELAIIPEDMRGDFREFAASLARTLEETAGLAAKSALERLASAIQALQDAFFCLLLCGVLLYLVQGA